MRYAHWSSRVPTATKMPAALVRQYCYIVDICFMQNLQYLTDDPAGVHVGLHVSICYS